ncbi:probable malonyl-CoA-acyl carrier protein transacylase, mitochondrial [Drosophila guanche]|uniref:[acyl-carrier-protein] S-malonyltransferase n=1 Tax=Drosophila guanche TaxID=7266 RepID=A0A3B0JSX8_DROGU|nr:probable malonyl-CoA-acyl carrier protein transacylase, mitochondrial [Drosophila guanche]SPP85217.1 blast:Probable malonyl-CoA-acyl carrier protein transacylase%2C mitochondrial [Drosophila guanche]
MLAVRKTRVFGNLSWSRWSSDAAKATTDPASALEDANKRQKLINELAEPLEQRRRPAIDPKETSVMLFPGQGSQYVGMAKDLLRFPGARQIFELANQVLKYDLLKICLEGPREKLNRTEHAQLAVMVSSLAALEQLREERPQAIENCVAAAGFSLGEITALVYAGAMPFDKAVKLVQVRATAMQAACDRAAGGMALTLYGPDTNLGEACAKAQQWSLDRGVESPYCGIANYMYPHCKVIAGNVEALEFLEKNAKALKIRRMKRLAVSGAFHTPLMQSAVEPFTKALKSLRLEDPIIRVYSNVDGKPYRNAKNILHHLPKQIVRSVKWEQTLHEMYERKQGAEFPRTFECGPGKGLMQVLEKVNAKAAQSCTNVSA